MKLKVVQRFDFILLFAVLALITLGVLFIYSAGVDSDGASSSTQYIKQMIWAGTGFVFMAALAIIDYRSFEKYASYLFLVLIGLLVLVRFSKAVNGAHSWIGLGSIKIQPSEFCKLFFILFLARYLNKSKNSNQLKRLVMSILIFMVPFGLIMIQPDMGTASVFFVILFFMLLFSGIPLRYIMLFFVWAALTVYLLVFPEWFKRIAHTTNPLVSVLTNVKLRMIFTLAFGAVCATGIVGNFIYKESRYFYWIAYCSGLVFAALIFSYIGGLVLNIGGEAKSDYWLKRLVIFMDPEIDPRGSGWQTLKSLTTVGSGGLFGKGFLGGRLIHSGYLPEANTDFIFGSLAEEFGFVGAILVFALYLVIFIRNLSIIKNCTIPFGIYIASGIFGIFFWHFVENVGMVISCMPITGIPLMFMSYGGSSLWTAMAAIGLLMSIRYIKYDFA